MNNSEYICAMCGNTYESGWTEEEARAEKNSYWPSVPIEECGVVCDDCWQLIKPDQQDAVRVAFEFIAAMKELHSMAGHTQEHFDEISQALLDMANEKES